jgi:hypothetical protein
LFPPTVARTEFHLLNDTVGHIDHPVGNSKPTWSKVQIEHPVRRPFQANLQVKRLKAETSPEPA